MPKKTDIQLHTNPCRHSCESRSPVLLRAFLDSRFRGNDDERVLIDEVRVDNDHVRVLNDAEIFLDAVRVMNGGKMDSCFRRNDEVRVLNNDERGDNGGMTGNNYDEVVVT
jgi:hypothetical protein